MDPYFREKESSEASGIMFPGQFGEQNTGCGAFYRKTLDPGPPKLFRPFMWAYAKP
jgi:hypothetical protein